MTAEDDRVAAAAAQSDGERSAAVRRITVWGLAVNVVLAALKFAAGWVGSSRAVMADALHSLSDCTSDVAVLVGVHYWEQPVDAEHPYGHGRIEQVVTALVGVILALAGAGVAWNAVSGIADPPGPPPTWIALGATVVSMIVKEILYRCTVRTGERVESQAVIANAWHHRSDALSSLPAFLGVATVMIDPSLHFVDHVAAVVVAFFILQTAAKIVFPSVGKLVDTAPPEELRDAIRATASEVDGVRTAHAMRTRWLGATVAVDLHVEVDPDLTVRAGHDIATAVSRRLKDEFREVVDVVVHVEPCCEDAPPP